VLQFPDEMSAAKQALIDAVRADRLSMGRLQQADERVTHMAQRYPAIVRPYGESQEALDRSLFTEAWARALTVVGAATPPQLGAKVRLVLQADAPSDGVSEAGLSAETLIERLRPLYDLDVVRYAARDTLDWAALPQDGAVTLLASTTRARYGERQRSTWRPDLHLALWNPYAAADLPCPALVTYGFAPPALDAVVRWLRGELEARGRLPAPLEGRATA